MKNLFALLLLALTGCTFTQHTHIAWLDPAYAPGGHSIYSLMNQKPKTTVAIYRDGAVPDRPYHEILMLAVDGNGNQEPDAVETFVDLSQRAGADAVVIKRPVSSMSVHEKREAQTAAAADNGSELAVEQNQNNTISAEGLTPNKRYLFQATAVVWDKHITTNSATH